MQYRRMRLFSLLAALVLIVAACAQPVPVSPAAPAGATASENQAGAGSQSAAGEAKPGGIWRTASIADAENLNPILSSDAASAAVSGLIFPGLVGQDPFSGELTPEGALAESWSASDDGLVWTFKLRQNVKWSDGDPVDAADFKFTYDAIASDKIETPRKDLLEGIKSIETPDPYTVVVTYDTVNCKALSNLGIALLPSHLYAADFSDIMENPMNEAPKVSAGPLSFNSWTRDDSLTLQRNPDYWEGAPYMDGMIFKVIPDTGTQLAQIQSGELDTMGLEPAQLETAKAIPDTTIFNFQDDGYDYIALNLANPDNPQPGRDADGKLIEQDPHPILGDLKVRQAIAHSLDYQTIIDQVYLGQGYQIGSNVLPAISWAYDPTVLPFDYNLDTAKGLLDEAGWTDSDGDGIRDQDGKKLSLSLLTNAGSNVREDLGALVQDQLKQVGIEVNFEAIDFGVLVERLLGQKFDMVIIGWTGLGADPNDDAFWKSDFDTPGSGFNFVSFQSARIDELLTQGVTVPGCSTEERAPYYQEIQRIIHDDVPYVFISGGVGNTLYSTKWQGINPGPWSFYYNVHQWSLSQ
ncbi:MAG TPA: ABC transporter substrate-binding protein [Caldilineaceae bacterium]|mgnify:CR=1 FL=1|nr:ABC transporter substrate-binding protein [Caldilineaceae bacterium]